MAAGSRCGETVQPPPETCVLPVQLADAEAVLAEENGTAALTLTTGFVFFFFFFFATAGEATPSASSAASAATPISPARLRKRAFSLPRIAAILPLAGRRIPA